MKKLNWTFWMLLLKGLYCLEPCEVACVCVCVFCGRKKVAWFDEEEVLHFLINKNSISVIENCSV